MPLFLVTTNRCNLKCKQCYVDAGKSLDELAKEDIINLIDEFSEINISQVILTGGEPLKRKDIFQIAQYTKNKGHKMTLLTNGTLIKNRLIAEKIADIFNTVQISLDGATSEHNDFYRGKGTFTRIINGINYFEDLDVKLRIAMMVTPRNYQDIRDNINLLFQNIKTKNISVNVGGLIERGRGIFCERGDSNHYIEEIIESARDKGIFYEKDKVKNVKHENCGYASGFNINFNGDVYLCPMIVEEFKFTNIKEKSLKKIKKEMDIIRQNTSVKKMEDCAPCDLKYICGGTCRLKNLESNKDISKPVCNPEFKDKIYEHLAKFD
jgi:radical SAM protein with 4Fe4S-binding SPASM domain